MALMFQRLARNYAKNGYFPTDSETTNRILNALKPAQSGVMRIIDPCAGEGVALRECKHWLGDVATQAFGIEYDEERAWHAKGLLDRCIHGDFNDCIIGRRQFGLLWLNPPYGDLVSDKAATGDKGGKGRKRLEKLFYQLANPMVQFGGVMVLIIPHYSLDRELSQWISRHFDRVQCFLAPERQFKQAVVFGVRKRTNERSAGVMLNDVGSESTVRTMLEAVGQGQLPPVLPVEWIDDGYTVPASNGDDITFTYTRMDRRQLEDEIQTYGGLWSQFDVKFERSTAARRPPLRALSNWHLALALAAGQVAGVVRSEDGRVYIIKGDTHKDKRVKVEMEERGKDKFAEVRIATDTFVPVIRAIDVTPGSESIGNILTIR